MMANADTIVMCSGWLKLGGIEALRSQIVTAVARGAKITFYSNRTPETERDAIDALADLGVEHIVVESRFYLHAKIYYFEAGDRFSALLGSANITEGGLRLNEELSVMIEGSVGDLQHAEIAAYLAHLDRRCRRAHGVTRRLKVLAKADVSP
ncbi:phospholipase D-like domain-containing protein [Paraburkholderia sediminicola]|uniref:phospholipase D-like domain-containing protein n=1 Tax=Paraburkholderia sediminicola TaxID=458836 RepID=UPI0038B7101F